MFLSEYVVVKTYASFKGFNHVLVRSLKVIEKMNYNLIIIFGKRNLKALKYEKGIKLTIIKEMIKNIFAFKYR